MLLFHRLLSINFAHLVIHLLTDSEAVGSELDFSGFVQEIHKDEFDLAGLEIGVDRHISNELKLMKTIVQIGRGI